jgi:hypothetical protein
MLIAAFVILGVAVLLGSVLAVLRLQTEGSTPPWSLAALHGFLAVGGLNCLALALSGPPRGLDRGVASFGIIATSLIALAALIGVALLATRIFKTQISGMMIGIHATLAVGGFVILTAYVLLG